MAENELVLKQRNKSGINVQIKLVGGRELQVFNKSKNAEQVYSIDVLSLQDKSKKILFIAWKWIIASFGFFLVMLLLLKIAPNYLDSNKNLFLGIILLVGTASSIFCFTRFWKNTSTKQIFYSRNAHVPIIILNAGNPSKETFSSFIDAVEKRIKKFRKHMNVSEDKQLTGEMKMLRRLCDNGIITKKSYEGAKAKLFSGFESNFTSREK